tara:strand:+ start:1347 stop:2429 length:1083 start_codon:yes stop_codon:yes gene_type:complete
MSEEIVAEADADVVEATQIPPPPSLSGNQGSVATPPTIRPIVVSTTVGRVGEALYPPLSIVEIPSELEGVQGAGIDLQFFMIPTTFNESFKSRWQSEDLSQGRINPIHNYGGTQREIALSFTLAALTVEEARSNLNICEILARTVYGRYRNIVTPASLTVAGRTDSIFAGHREFTIDFGSLIRNERSFINKFSFTANIDSGVFDYAEGNDTEVTHGKPGVALPREVNIDIGLTIVHYHLLGFGGKNRPNEPLRWAENKDRDWPHGAGSIALQTYMSISQEVNPLSLPRVLKSGDDDFYRPIRSADAVEEAYAAAVPGAIADRELAAQIAHEDAMDLAAGIAPTSFRPNPPEDYLVSESEP